MCGGEKLLPNQHLEAWVKYVILRPHCTGVTPEELSKMQVAGSHPERFWVSGLWFYICIKHPASNNVSVPWPTHLKSSMQTHSPGQAPTYTFRSPSYDSTTQGVCSMICLRYHQIFKLTLSLYQSWTGVAPEPLHTAEIRSARPRDLRTLLELRSFGAAWEGTDVGCLAKDLDFIVEIAVAHKDGWITQ